MDQLIESIKKHRVSQDRQSISDSEYDQRLQSVQKFLRSAAFTKGEFGDGAPELLGQLDPALDTLPYLHILSSQISGGASKGDSALPPSLRLPDGALWLRVSDFLNRFDPVEARYAGAEWRKVVGAVLSAGRTAGRNAANRVATSVAGAILRLDPSAGTLTSTQINFVRFCIGNGCYEEAAVVLDHDIHSFPSKDAPEETDTFLCSEFSLSNAFINVRSGFTEKLSLNSVQEYYMLGAMAYIGLKRWDRALYFLEHIMSTPTANVANGMMLEAYRKWLFVSLLDRGRAHALPRTFNPAAHRHCKHASKHYEAVVEAFKQPTIAMLQAEIHEAAPLFKRDGNLGLTRDVVECYQDFRVIRLKDTYDALHVSDAATILNTTPEQVKQYVQKLVSQGKLGATLEAAHEPGGSEILRFSQHTSTGPLAKSESQLYTELMGQAERIKLLSEHVDEVDRRLSLSKEYVEWTKRVRKQKQDRDAVAAGEPLDPFSGGPGGPQSDDENVMADFV